jgi:hypothetical protein
MLPSTWRICASIARVSSVNRRSPLATLAPSAKCTPTISLSSRLLTATLAIVVTLPRPSSSTGMLFFTAVATSTDTGRGPCGAWAIALPVWLGEWTA